MRKKEQQQKKNKEQKNALKTLYNIDQIDRGYESIDVRLNALGAKIRRIKD